MDGASAPLLLIRHGQTEWNLLRRWQGRAESALTDLGRAQAARAAEHLAGIRFAEIWTSPLSRAFDTAQIIAERLGVAEVRVDERLIETDVGVWEGLTLAELEQGWPGYLAQRRHPEGFEPDAAVIARMTAACTDRLHSGGAVLAVTHSGVMRTLRRHLGVVDHRISNLGGYWISPGHHHPLRAGDIFSFLSPSGDTRDTTRDTTRSGASGAAADPQTDSL